MPSSGGGSKAVAAGAGSGEEGKTSTNFLWPRAIVTQPLRATVRRDLHEEAGLGGEVGDLAWVVENFWPPDEEGASYHALTFVYHVRAVGEPAGPQDPDGYVQQVCWVPVSELDAYLQLPRRRGWRVLWEPLMDYVRERWQGVRFYGFT